MNTAYKAIWNEALGAWVATSEIASARGKKSRAGRKTDAALKTLTAVALASLMGVSQVAMADVVVGDTSADCVNPYNLTGPNTISVNIGCRVNTSGVPGQTSVGIGTDVVATGNQSVAIGAGAASPTFYGIAIGAGAQAIGYPHYGAIAIGWGAISSDGYAVALGANSQAAGAGAFAGGLGARAQAHWATAIGTYSQAAGLYSTAVGYGAVVGGDNAVAMGQSFAGGVGSTAVGWQNYVTGASSTAVGVGNQVTGNGSGAFGDPNIISGNGSYALGNNNTIAQNNTFVVGNGVTTTQANSVVLGNASADRAATTVTSATIGGQTYTFAGPGSVANGVVSVGAPGAERQVINVAAGSVSATSTDAINGSQLYATNQAVDAVSAELTNINNGAGIKYFHANSTLADSNPTGANAVAIGPVAVASGVDSIATGNGASAGAMGSIALGAGAVASSNAGDVALGAGSTTAPVVATTSTTIAGTTYNYAGTVPTSTVSVGAPGAERTITNVAAGRVSGTSTDAVNGSQLYATNQAVDAVNATVMNINNGAGIKYFHANSTLADSTPTGANAVAIGPVAVASGADSIAAGNGASSVVAGSVALGAGSIADRAAGTYLDPITGASFSTLMGAVSVGSTGSLRQITNVAPGTQLTDAVNLGQLEGAVSSLNQVIQTITTTPTNPGGGSESGPTYITGNPTTYTPPVASGKDGTAAGSGAVASGTGSTAIGNNAVASGSNSVAIGANSVASAPDTVSVGSVGNERTISNVRPGVNGTDAVNVNQLTNGLGNLQNQISQNRDAAYAGTAAAIAISGLRYDDRPGKISGAAATGYYHGQVGLALGLGGTSENGRWRVNGGLTVTPTLHTPDFGAVVGVSHTFN